MSAEEAQQGGPAQTLGTPIELRTAPASRGVWQMIVDALTHGRSLAIFGRREQRPDEEVREVMQTHVVEPAQRAALEAESKPRSVSNIA